MTLISLIAIQAAVRHINVRDGLSSRQVYEVEEDPDGFIWIYTNSGLDRFDGHTVKHYRIDPNEEHSDHIQSATSMETASDGTVWIAVKSGAIYRYNRLLDRFEVAFRFTDPSVLLYNFDVVDNDRLVVCTNRGLYNCTPDKGIELMALDGKLVRAVIPDGAGGFYAGTDHGLYRVTPNGSGYRSRFVSGTEGLYVLSLAISSGRLFVGTFSNGIVIIGPDGHPAGLPFHIPPLPVNVIKSYDGDSLLIGVDGAGVYLVDSSDGTLLHHYRDGDDTDDDLSGNTVTDVHVGRDKGIWVATSHNGINYIPPLSHTVNILRSKSGNPASLISDYVNVIFEDSDGDLWFGTDKGVSRYSPSLNRWWRYMQRSDYVAGVVLSLGEDSRGRILVGTYGDGLNIIDKATGSVTRMPVQAPGSASGVGTDYVFAGYGMPDGNIWIGGINGPLTRYNINDGSYRYYDEDCIATIVPDAGGPLFGGNKGVGRYQPASDLFAWTQIFDSITLRYPVRTLLADTVADVLWIGTQGDGLLRHDRGSGNTRRFTTDDGLSSNTIYSLSRDGSGCVWVCTETDLYRFAAAGDSMMRFTYFLGTNRGVFNAGGGMSTRAGDIMLGSAEGCVVFNPSEQFREDARGAILLTDFLVHDRPMQPGDDGSPLSRNINLTDHIELSHKQNSFELRYALIDHVSPRRIGFEYMLEGYDDRPVTAGAGTGIRYSDLPSGSYILVIKAIDLYSGKAFTERRLDIVVRPPMWLSPWAMCIYALLAATLLWFVITTLRRVRHERHIESQLRSYAAIAHDIRTPMSMIKSPLLNIELEGGLSESARANLLQARAGIEKTMGMLDEMLGLRREAKGARQLRVQSVNILEYLHVKIEEYSTLALFKGIRIECDVASDMPRVMIDPDKFDHIVDNLMSNAIKYTNHGKITLSARRSGRRHWALSVADTGIGMSVADARYVFKRRHRSPEAAGCDASGTGLGLLITGRLVHDHRGKITFISEQGRGSTFTVTLPVEFAPRYRAVPLPGTDETGNAADTADTDDSAQHRSTVYVIDDDPDMRAFLKAQLGDEYNVITSDNPASALDDIRSGNPDLVISDIMMPRLRGDEMCRMLKTNIDTSHIPVILLTGLAGREDIVSGLEARADDYIIKPFDIVVLKARIRNIIKSRRELGKRVLAEDCEPAQEEFSSELDRRFMTRTMEIINEHLSDSEYSVNELCADLGMSRTSVYNKIKSLSGQSPNEFMRIMRLNRSKELLATRNYNISEVAYMVGFSDPKYFSTCFKKQFGFSPSKI